MRVMRERGIEGDGESNDNRIHFCGINKRSHWSGIGELTKKKEKNRKEREKILAPA